MDGFKPGGGGPLIHPPVVKGRENGGVMRRRDFIAKAGLGAAAATAATVVNAPFVHAKKKVTWKMVTTWPPKLPYLQTAADYLAKKVEEASGGRFRIRVYAGRRAGARRCRPLTR